MLRGKVPGQRASRLEPLVAIVAPPRTARQRRLRRRFRRRRTRRRRGSNRFLHSGRDRRRRVLRLHVADERRRLQEHLAALGARERLRLARTHHLSDGGDGVDVVVFLHDVGVQGHLGGEDTRLLRAEGAHDADRRRGRGDVRRNAGLLVRRRLRPCLVRNDSVRVNVTACPVVLRDVVRVGAVQVLDQVLLAAEHLAAQLARELVVREHHGILLWRRGRGCDGGECGRRRHVHRRCRWDLQLRQRLLRHVRIRFAAGGRRLLRSCRRGLRPCDLLRDRLLVQVDVRVLHSDVLHDGVNGREQPVQRLRTLRGFLLAMPAGEACGRHVAGDGRRRCCGLPRRRHHRRGNAFTLLGSLQQGVARTHHLPHGLLVEWHVLVAVVDVGQQPSDGVGLGAKRAPRRRQRRHRVALRFFEDKVPRRIRRRPTDRHRGGSGNVERWRGVARWPL
mmetsp:Transcript_31664/g.97896  ORF Transcript_31664/g.97896 Transcript_31664/m.97896 type:complete len:448 (-) Transcript_31664:175-1518(-)